MQAQMKPPVCLHKEPCVVRVVKKAGENNGRSFYCCARPDGAPPEGRCRFFQYATKRGKAAGSGGGA